MVVHDRIIKQVKAKVCVFPDSVLCLGGKCTEYPQSAKAWSERVEWFTHTSQYRELDDVDGELVVFEWKIFSGHTTMELLREVQELMEKELKVSRTASSSCRCTTALIGQEKATKKFVETSLRVLQILTDIISKDIGHSSDQEVKKSAKKPDGAWNEVAADMVASFEESGHLALRGTSPLSRGALKSKGGGKTSKHYKADPQTAELLLRTIFAVNQFSIYGAVADWCPAFTQRAEGHSSQSAGKLAAKVSDDEVPEVPSELVSCLTKNTTWNSNAQGNLVQQGDGKFQILPEDVQLMQISEDAGFTRSISAGQFFVTNAAVKLEGHVVVSSCREHRHPRNHKRA